MIYTTLNAIRAKGPCADGWRKLLAHLGKTEADDEPLALATILDSNGLDDAIWCLRAVEGHRREMRLFAVACALDVQHRMTNPRSLAALDVAKRHANGLATDEELDAASAAASVAALVAARAAAGGAAEGAAWAAARAAAWGAAWAAAWAAARAAAWAAAEAAAEGAASAAADAARYAQTARFREMFCQKEVTA